MSRITGIEWTDATWNPIRGCSRVSEGCRNCYAETVANRFCGPGSPYEGVVQIGSDGKGNGKWNGQIKFVEKHLLDPLKWKKPQRIFVNSMSDLFHENVTDEMRDKIFAVMALCPQHTFQVLTKRPERMLEYLTRGTPCTNISIAAAEIIAASSQIFKAAPEGFERRADGTVRCDGGIFDWNNWPLPNVWLGVSVENQKAADERIPLLLQTPAAVRFISAEPLLGPVDLAALALPSNFYGTNAAWCSLGATAINALRGYSDNGDWRRLDWVIVGGESGPGARPMHPDWARSLRDQCGAAGVPFFFKQWGELAPGAQGADFSRSDLMTTRINLRGEDVAKGPYLATDGLFYRTGKKAAGHLLDGKEWHQMPGATA